MNRKTVAQHLNEKDAAARIGVSVRFLRKMRSMPGQDPLPFVKIGSLVRYSEADLSDWLERRRVCDSLEASRLKDVG